MTDPIQTLTPQNISGYWPSANATTSPEAQDNAFQKMLSTMLMASGMSSMNGSEGDSQSTMMMPLMMMLMEQLLAQQVQSGAAESINPSAYVPSGRPVEGPVTQDSHGGHVALDFGVATGTPVRSTMSGNVVYAGWNNEGYGNLVVLENGPYRTYYAHLSEIPVTVGQTVQAGAVIGLSGNTGNSTGPHLHYEIRLNQEQINPSTMTLI